MPRQSSPRLTFAVLAIGTGVFAMLQSLVAPALPIIQQELHASQMATTWVMTSYLLAASVFTPILGKVGDLVGKKRTLVAVLFALVLGSLLAALAPSIGVLILARVIQGVGGALIPLSFGIIRDELEDRRVGPSISNLSALSAAGGGIGIVAAGPIVSALGYRWLFWLPVGIVAITAAIALRHVPESPNRAGGRINWIGAVLLSAWLVALLLPVTQASRWGWTSGSTLGLFTAAVVLFLLWLCSESRSRDPLIDMQIFRRRPVWTTNVAALLFGAGMYGLWTFLPAFAQTPPSAGYGFGVGATGSGLLMLPMLATTFFAGVLGGRLQPVVGAKALLVSGATLATAALALLTALHDEQWQAAVAAGLLGTGIGLSFGAMATIVVHNVPAEQTGAATGMNANLRTIGGAMGAAVAGVVVTSQVQPSGLPHASGYTHAFGLLTLLCLAATLVSLAVPADRAAALPAAAGAKKDAVATSQAGAGESRI